MKIEKKVETLAGYGACHACTTTVYYPKNRSELQDLVALSNQNGQQFAIKGSGLSIDAQFLNKQMVISMQLFQYVRIQLDDETVTVGAGTVWGDILERIIPMGYTVHAAPSATQITAGGTFSACSISRFTPTYGTSGNLVKSFKILTTTGELLNCSPTENKDLFLGAISSWGSLGIVYEISYQMECVGAKPKLFTATRRFEGLGSLQDILQPQNNFDKEEPEYWGGAGSTIFASKNKIRVMATKHRYGQSKENKPFLLHQHRMIRNVGDVVLRLSTRFPNVLWNTTYRQFGKRKEVRYIDDLYEATFFMESNLGTKKFLDNVGLKFKTVQETYFIPFSEQEQGEYTAIARFIHTAFKKLKAYRLRPAMFDALFVAKGLPFVLSSNQGQKGFLTSIVFEGRAVKEITYMKQFFQELQMICLELGGRLHLTKNAFVEPDILQEMYGESLVNFAKLKQEYDPSGLLQNDFFARISPTL